MLNDTSVREHINVLGPEGDTLLHLSCLYAHEECAQLLLEHGADVTVVDEDCSTVLHDAAAGGYASNVFSPAALQRQLTSTSNYAC